MKAGGEPRGDVVAVCGLAAEVRLAARCGLRGVAGGGDSTALGRAIEAELAAGARAILSFGIAGALGAGLPPGSLVVADAVVDASGRRYACDRRWSERLRTGLRQSSSPESAEAMVGTVFGSDEIVVSVAEKVRLHQRFGATIVDMESHVAARIAAEQEVPFAVLRGVADSADRALPPAALVGMRPGGGVDVLAVVAALLRSPRQLPALLAVAGDARRGLGALERGGRRLGHRLGDLDLDQLALDVV